MSGRERRTVLDRCEALLERDPARPTRNVKVLRANPLARYELRLGYLRVFFEIEEDTANVLVLAVGRKEGNRLWIAGEEVAL
jgi:mRNA-degrading endonuclease RelE of RelBE toxin-antitoxin system